MDTNPQSPPGDEVPNDEVSNDYHQFTFEYLLDEAQEIEADPNMSETTSLTDSIFEYQRENGRTYHAYHAGSYYIPNDDRELERENFQFEILHKVFDGRLYLAPLSHDNPPRKILDVATGTGRWAIEMADEFPDAKVIGTDLSPIQPTSVPPNLEFIIDDGNEEWLTGPDWCDIDYIHYRSTIASWRSWKFMIRTAFERLSPGGWLELQEPECDIACDDAEIPPDNALKKWFAQLSEASIIAERPIHETPELKRMLEEAGFVDVQEKVYKIPLNGWPSIRELKEVGHMWQVILDSGFSGFSYALFHRHLKMSKEEIEVDLVNVRRALADQRIHAHEKFYVIWGRKPETAGRS